MILNLLDYLLKKEESNMYLIIGLGNPEPQYLKTRHNMGFDVINKIAKKYEIEVIKSKFKAFYGTGNINGKKVILLKPQTYMNSSGEAIKKYIDFYRIPFQNILVIYDDMDTDIGCIRVRKQGGAGSHNGMKSLIRELGTEEFSRVRIGIGVPKNKEDKINYVIGRIKDEEYEKLEKGQDKAVEAVECFVKVGIDDAMNKFN